MADARLRVRARGHHLEGGQFQQSAVQSGAHGKQRSQFLHLLYRYQVDGQSYEGNRIQAGTFGMASGDSLKKFGDRFAEGQEVFLLRALTTPPKAGRGLP